MGDLFRAVVAYAAPAAASAAFFNVVGPTPSSRGAFACAVAAGCIAGCAAAAGWLLARVVVGRRRGRHDARPT